MPNLDIFAEIPFGFGRFLLLIKCDRFCLSSLRPKATRVKSNVSITQQNSVHGDSNGRRCWSISKLFSNGSRQDRLMKEWMKRKHSLLWNIDCRFSREVCLDAYLALRVVVLWRYNDSDVFRNWRIIIVSLCLRLDLPSLSSSGAGLWHISRQWRKSRIHATWLFENIYIWFSSTYGSGTNRIL